MIPALPEWPQFGLADDVRPLMAKALAAAEASALVTLTRVEGGGPRPVGTQMLFTQSEVTGFLSGGCVEGDVAAHAAATLADGEPRRLVYGEGGPWPDIRLLCGARIELYVERIDPDDVSARKLIDDWKARRPAIRVIDGFERRYDPTLRLVVVGGDPTALAIAQLGQQSGFETTLVRPKGPITAPPLPGVAYRRETSGEALPAIGLDRWTAVAIATHDLDTDEEALLCALPSEAFYVGLLGARRRLAGRLDRLRAAGVASVEIDRLHAPIGLRINPTGKSPWEVAVAVIGEIMTERELALQSVQG